MPNRHGESASYTRRRVRCGSSVVDPDSTGHWPGHQLVVIIEIPVPPDQGVGTVTNLPRKGVRRDQSRTWNYRTTGLRFVIPYYDPPYTTPLHSRQGFASADFAQWPWWTRLLLSKGWKAPEKESIGGPSATNPRREIPGFIRAQHIIS